MHPQRSQKRGQEAGKKEAEGKVGVEEGEEVREADMLMGRDKHFSAVVILGEAMTSLGLLIAMFGRGVIAVLQRAADTVWNISLMLAKQRHWDA